MELEECVGTHQKEYSQLLLRKSNSASDFSYSVYKFFPQGKALPHSPEDSILEITEAQNPLSREIYFSPRTHK